MKKKNNKILWFLTIIAIVLSAIACTSIFTIPFFNNDDEKIELDRFDYTFGTIDNDSGKLLDSKKSIRTRDLHSIEGIDIDLKDDATVSYKVAYYDADKKFVSVSEETNGDYDVETAPEEAVYVRIFVTPYQIDGEDVILNVFNIGKYVDQIEVTVNE